MDPRRKNNVIMTSKRSCFDIAIMSLLRSVPIGQAYMARPNFLFYANDRTTRLACRNDCCVSFGYINNENYTGGQNSSTV